MTRTRIILALAGLLVLVAIPYAWATIDGVYSIGVQINDRRTVGLNTNANLPVNATPSITYSNGSGASQATTLFQATRTFSGTTDTLSLSSGLSDAYGSAVVLVRVKAVFFLNNGTSTIVIGGGTGAMSSWLSATGTLTIPAGGFVGSATPDATGWVVTSGTADKIQVTGTSGQTYQVVVLGSTS
jgi:hypothetical protein